MKVIIWIIIIALIVSLASTIWPLFLILAILFVAWKLYETYYYKSPAFIAVKQRIDTYINDCNELNRHIESLKDTTLISNRTDYGDASYKDSSHWDYKRKHLQGQKYATNVHNCSRTVCDNARKKPFEYVCKYFGIKATEETLANYESILNNFEAAEDGKISIQTEKKKILESIQNDVPILIKKFSSKKLEKKLGFEEVDMSTAYFPKYIFKYISSGGNAST